MASRSPVEAPLGTMARPLEPSASHTSASTVGLPRESSTWRPRISEILLMDLCFSLNEIVFESDILQPRCPREAELKVRLLPVRYPTPVYVLAMLCVKLEIINDRLD